MSTTGLDKLLGSCTPIAEFPRIYFLGLLRIVFNSFSRFFKTSVYILKFINEIKLDCMNIITRNYNLSMTTSFSVSKGGNSSIPRLCILSSEIFCTIGDTVPMSDCNSILLNVLIGKNLKTVGVSLFHFVPILREGKPPFAWYFFKRNGRGL